MVYGGAGNRSTTPILLVLEAMGGGMFSLARNGSSGQKGDWKGSLPLRFLPASTSNK